MRMYSSRLWIKIEHYENTAVQDETIYDDHFLIGYSRHFINGQYLGLTRNLLEYKVNS
mgnify:CR=1 FL=1